MSLKSRFFSAIALSMLVVVVGSSQIQAITDGTPDTSNLFRNVGALLAVAPDGTDFQFCSGTLIAPTVFLTAAHCAHFFDELLLPQGFTLYVSFGNSILIGDTPDLSTLIPVTQIIANPKYVEADHQIFNPQHGSDPGDIAVAILPLGSTLGIPPATLPTLGLLDQLAAKNGLQRAVFTAVGYGSVDRFGTQLNPVPRMFAPSAFSALEVGYVQLSINPTLGNGGDCIGDSGGPNFLNVNGGLVLMATSSIAGDHVCRATSGDYRLDTATARDFLKDYVALP